MATYLKHKNCNIRVIFFFLFHHQLKREKTKIKGLIIILLLFFNRHQKIQKKNLNDKLVLNNGKFIEQQSERFVESRLSKLY